MPSPPPDGQAADRNPRRPEPMTVELEVIARDGDGEPDRPPLLFVPGARQGAWCWAEHLLDFFAGRAFNSYALNLRGYGESAGRERLRWASIAEYVSDVEQVAAGLPSVPVLAGHSLGDPVGQKYPETHEALTAL